MKTRILLGAALLLSVAGVSVAATTSHIPVLNGHHGDDADLRRSADDGAPMRLAREEGRHERVAERRGHDDEEDDDDEDEGGRALPQNGPVDPTVPVPDNGLFKDRARPKVEVQ